MLVPPQAAGPYECGPQLTSGPVHLRQFAIVIPGPISTCLPVDTSVQSNGHGPPPADVASRSGSLITPEIPDGHP